MPDLRFSKLSLLSHNERSGLQIDLSARQTLLVAGNGFGKSAIVKSLYETLGAKPHKIDKAWRNSQVTSILEFSVGQHSYYAMKFADTFAVFDVRKRPLIVTNKVTSELGPFLADLLQFRLRLSDRQNEIVVPPPSFAFAPYYVDQDRSWQRTWASFSDLGMFARSSQALAEYHSGLRTNDYYDAKADRDQCKAELSAVDAQRSAVHQAIETIRAEMSSGALVLSLSDFEREISRLVEEAQKLHEEQSKYRTELASLNETYNLWRGHVKVIEQGMREIDDAFDVSIEHPADVECPMCGQHYVNDIASQFALKAESGDLFSALQIGRSNLSDAEARLHSKTKELDRISAAITDVQATLAVAKRDISLRDVVHAEGRAEAERVLQGRLVALDSACAELERSIRSAEERMQAADAPERKADIRALFAVSLTTACQSLDVPLGLDDTSSLQGTSMGRGSVGPRGLAAYYFAFLQTARTYSSSAFCPIVIDAPNQQGQDQGHLAAIMEFLLSQAPDNSQIIIAAEAVTDAHSASLIDVSYKKRQVLREDRYDEVLQYVGPFMNSLLT